jgi:hypothetical protein
MRASRSLALLLVLAGVLAGLGGCAEVEEQWVLGEKGGGTWTLSLRWNADLWRRVRGVLGPAVTDRLRGRALPLRPQAWRDSLAGVEGVTIVECEERDTDTGMRELRVQLRFEKLRALMQWELMRRRTVRVETRPAPGAAENDPPLCRFAMEPIARVPVLDPLAALLEARDNPPPAAEGAAAARDPSPLARLGLEEEAAGLVWKMVKPQLDKVRLRFAFRPPFGIESIRDLAVARGTEEAVFDFDFAALRDPRTDRTAVFTWQMRAFDEAPLVVQQGDRDPRARGPEGHTR